jgi:uncharacterized protein (TIGR02996 family)
MAGPQATRAAFEDALADNPDDLATHMAYADFLVEQGDPRGELIQVQLALEDESRPARERKRLQKRERELLAAHEREWLGELAPLLLGTEEEWRELFVAESPPRYEEELEWVTEHLHFRHGWARGWLDRFECGAVTVGMMRRLGRAPIARLLRALVCREGQGEQVATDKQKAADLPPRHPNGYCYYYPCEVLAHYPAVRNVRFFQYGTEVDPEEDGYHAGTKFHTMSHLVASMPRLEELHVLGHVYFTEECRADMKRLFALPTLSNLRVLQYYHETVYPLEALARNPALGRLEQLLCFPHSGAGYAMDTKTFAGAIHRQHARALVKSRHLRCLTHLQLRCCSGGDEMVRDVVASGVLKRLKVLDLRHGRITDEGARLFAACPEAHGLEALDLINNRLTPAGVAALQAAGLRARAERQLGAGHPEDAYVWFGDSE